MTVETIYPEIEEVQIINSNPDSYRIKKLRNGEYVLEGAYFWQKGSAYGHEWKPIPTIYEENL